MRGGPNADEARNKFSFVKRGAALNVSDSDGNARQVTFDLSMRGHRRGHYPAHHTSVPEPLVATHCAAAKAAPSAEHVSL